MNITYFIFLLLFFSFSLSAQDATFVLQSTLDSCDRTITLNWDLANDWENEVEAYEIWVNKNEDVQERIAVIMGNQKDYVFQNVENGGTYEFFVNAIEQNTGAKTTSNTSQITAAMVVNSVGDLLVKNITFTDEGAVELLWEWNSNADLASAKIFRSSDNRSFENVGNPDVTNPLPNPANFSVTPIHAKEGKTFYRVSTVDQCDSSRLSNYVSTIFLEGTALPTNENQLTWTPYDSRIGTVNGYSIYKLVEEEPQFLGRINGANTTFADPIITPADAGACYYVEADFSVTFASSGIETHISRSNTICLSQMATIVMPNAFAPNGQNRNLKPTILFRETVANYQFAIYNRYGGKIFETTDLNRGWNGQRDGKDIPTGTYTYLVRIVQINGEQVEKAGGLILLR